MGRIIVADERVQKCLDSLKSNQGWTLGLIIGQITAQKDYVVHLARTPDPQTEETATKRGTLETVDEGWVATHAKQVLRMLPGGLDIVGLFAMAPQDTMKSAQLQLRKVLFSIQKVVGRSQPITSEVHSDRLLLNICSHTTKVTCRTFDVADVKCAGRPAEWKVQSFLSSWISVESTLTMDHVIPVSVPALSQTLNKQIQNGLRPLVENIWAGLATVDGQLRGPDEQVSTSPQGSQGQKKSRKGQEGTKAQKVTVQLLLPQSPKADCNDNVTVTECGAQMRLRGTMASCALVHPKATVSEVTKAVQRDVSRSLAARCDLLCEDLLQAEEEQDPRVLYETPTRVHGQVPDSCLLLCDYVFQDEAATDSLDRFRELLGLDLTTDDLDMELEHVPTDSEVALTEETTENIHEEDTTSTQKMTARNLLGPVVGGLIAALAAGVSYLYLGDQ